MTPCDRRALAGIGRSSYFQYQRVVVIDPANVRMNPNHPLPPTATPVCLARAHQVSQNNILLGGMDDAEVILLRNMRSGMMRGQSCGA